MSPIETMLITAFLTTIVLAPKALDAWLSQRDAERASHEEAMLPLATGGAE